MTWLRASLTPESSIVLPVMQRARIEALELSQEPLVDWPWITVSKLGRGFEITSVDVTVGLGAEMKVEGAAAEADLDCSTSKDSFLYAENSALGLELRARPLPSLRGDAKDLGAAFLKLNIDLIDAPKDIPLFFFICRFLPFDDFFPFLFAGASKESSAPSKSAPPRHIY